MARQVGQISPSTTTLFWGAGGNLKFIVLAWAAVALGYNTTQASALTGVVAIGTAVGAVVASMRMRLDAATKVIRWHCHGAAAHPHGVHQQHLAGDSVLILLGGLGGYLVVPMNAAAAPGPQPDGRGSLDCRAKLQRTGLHPGPGRVLQPVAQAGLSVFGAITAFGLVVAGTMWLIRRWHISNCHRHREEVEHLLHIARHHHHH